MPQQPQQPAAPENPDELIQAMQGVGSFLGQLLKNMGQSLPPEVAKAIPVVQQFLLSGPQAQAQPPQDVNAAGAKQVMPAEQPMNPKAVPARG